MGDQVAAVVEQFHPLIGGKAENLVAARRLHREGETGASTRGQNGGYDGAVLAGPLECGLPKHAGRVDLDAVQLVLQATVTGLRGQDARRGGARRLNARPELRT